MRIQPSVSRWAACVALATLGLLLQPSLFTGGQRSSALAADPTNNVALRGSGLPIPRFASLKSDEVNVRTGPGPRYPVDWVFTRKMMPVEIVAEYENWRKIRDWQGTSGWVLQSLLTGKRGFVTTREASVFRTPALSAEVVAKLELEVMGEIHSCQGDWCRVKVSGGVSGWLARTDLWGVYKSEPIN
jgi:SH3-like domain-containing protein